MRICGIDHKDQIQKVDRIVVEWRRSDRIATKEDMDVETRDGGYHEKVFCPAETVR